MHCFSSLTYYENIKLIRKFCKFCGGHHCFRHCSWPLVKPINRQFIGLNHIFLCFDISSQITKIECTNILAYTGYPLLLPPKIFKNNRKNNINNSLLFGKQWYVVFCPPPLNFFLAKSQHTSLLYCRSRSVYQPYMSNPVITFF